MGREEDERQPKVYAYVFMHLVEPGRDIQDVLESLREVRGRRRHPVRFAAPFVGSFIGFAAVDADTFPELQSLVLNEFWAAGVRSEWSIVFRESQALGPHRGSNTPYYALVRAKAAPGRAFDALDALDRVYVTGGKIKEERPGEFRYHAAVVSGKGFDLVVELGAESLPELQKTIIEDLAGVEHVVSTDTSFTFLPENL